MLLDWQQRRVQHRVITAHQMGHFDTTLAINVDQSMLGELRMAFALA
jgi:hypothetical protein